MQQLSASILGKLDAQLSWLSALWTKHLPVIIDPQGRLMPQLDGHGWQHNTWGQWVLPDVTGWHRTIPSGCSYFSESCQADFPMFCFSTFMKILLKHDRPFLDVTFLVMFLAYLISCSDDLPDFLCLISPVFQRRPVELTFYILFSTHAPTHSSVMLYRCAQYVLCTLTCMERTRHNPSTHGPLILVENGGTNEQQIAHTRIL